MRKPASGTPAHIPAIPADKITSIIRFLESSLREAEADQAKSNDRARAFYQGRSTAFLHALELLREVAK